MNRSPQPAMVGSQSFATGALVIVLVRQPENASLHNEREMFPKSVC